MCSFRSSCAKQSLQGSLSRASSRCAECILMCRAPSIIMALCCLQINGHVTDEEGKKKIALSGKWDSYLDMQKCDEEGAPLPDAELVRLWTVYPCRLACCAILTHQKQCSFCCVAFFCCYAHFDRGSSRCLWITSRVCSSASLSFIVQCECGCNL